MQQLDRLAAYENDAIGREFVAQGSGVVDERRRHGARRMELLMQDWKETLGESQRLPKSALRNTCTFEHHKIYSESLITWAVTIILSALAGIMCALVIRQL